VGEEKVVDFHRWTFELPANQHSPLVCRIGCPGWLVKVVKFENIVFFKLKLRFLAQQKTRNGVFRPPPGSWLAPLGIQMDPRSSADAVNKRNGLHQCARPQAIVDKKTEFSLLKKRSQILAPLTQKSSGGSRFFSVFSTFSYRMRAK